MTRRRKLTEPQAWRLVAERIARPRLGWPMFTLHVVRLRKAKRITPRLADVMILRVCVHMAFPASGADLGMDMNQVCMSRSLAALFLARESAEETRGRAR